MMSLSGQFLKEPGGAFLLPTHHPTPHPLPSPHHRVDTMWMKNPVHCSPAPPIWNRHFEPRLPLDLERSIFETTALSHPSTIPNLMLIAWRVKSWIEPQLYRMVSSTHPRSAQLPVAPLDILSRDLAHKCPSVFRGVKHLFLYTAKDTSKVDAVLAACPSITDLFLYVPIRGSLPMLASMPSLRRLVIQPRTLLAFDPDHPIFCSVTHLELLEISTSAEAEDVCTKLAMMPKLTHLALNSIEIYHALIPSLEAFDHLRCMIMLSSEERREMEVDEIPAPLTEDDRFLWIGQTHADSYEDWLRSAHTGETYWAVADAFIAARRAGKIDRSCYSICDEDRSWRI
ncbi:hypothetical protein C8F04DRAFT_40345 [Mycena alexandri]|uniref:Uncharacterized protein n=1 Tax=Mycena alexandri TaxID=1745969 RepID=A0AAD6SKR8_9AGAR|nr:hypothetical protein C8F04DRAFT_40345 [Mycena alexandri]